MYLRLSPSFGGHNHDRYQQGHHRDNRRRSWQEYLSYLRYERQRNDPSARKIDARRAAETLGKYSALPHRHGGVRRIPSHGRQLTALGHDVRLMPAKYVKPFLKSHKNDYRDAEAIAEAVTT